MSTLPQTGTIADQDASPATDSSPTGLEPTVPGQNRQRIRIHFDYPLGDLVVLGGVLRELHRCYPGRYDVEVESSIAEYWEHCPHAKLAASRNAAQDPCFLYPPTADPLPAPQSAQTDEIAVHFDGRAFAKPNQRPLHMLQSLVEFLNDQLDIHITVDDFRGEIQLAPEDRDLPGPVEALLGRRVPYWIICDGGKFDRTVKWWPTENYQKVVTTLQDRVLFVQVGRSCDYHPKLRAALDFRGWSDIRTLLRLVYWSEGVVCPITSLMHLAAAVPRPPDRPGTRPCVVVGGGIEPPHWSAYPGHRFLSVTGALPCAGIGCWKARTVSLGDGTTHDRPEGRCVAVEDLYPRCMRLIRSMDVVRAVEGYIEGGMAPVLTPDEKHIARKSVNILGGDALDDRRFSRPTARLVIERYAKAARTLKLTGDGRGIVTLISGLDFVASAWVMLRLQRQLGCRLPAQVWLMGDRHWLTRLKDIFSPLDAEVKYLPVPIDSKLPRSSMFAAKAEIIAKSRFLETLWLDADSFPARDPSYLFELPEYREHGAVLWPEPAGYLSTRPEAWPMFGLPEDQESSEVQGGEMLFDKARVSPSLCLALWCNRQYHHIYAVLSGDKDIFRLAFKKMGQTYAMPSERSVLRDGCLFQVDFTGQPLFQHRVATKLRVGKPLHPVAGFLYVRECQAFLDEFTDRLAPALTALSARARRGGREEIVEIQAATERDLLSY